MFCSYFTGYIVKLYNVKICTFHTSSNFYFRTTDDYKTYIDKLDSSLIWQSLIQEGVGTLFKE